MFAVCVSRSEASHMRCFPHPRGWKGTCFVAAHSTGRYSAEQTAAVVLQVRHDTFSYDCTTVPYGTKYVDIARSRNASRNPKRSSPPPLLLTKFSPTRCKVTNGEQWPQ